jgi:miniconductance mechanosensitive channel
MVLQVPQPGLDSGILSTLGPIGEWIVSHPVWGALIVAVVVIAVGELLHRLTRLYLLRLLRILAERSRTAWDDAFFEVRTPQRLTWVVPLLVWYFGVLLVPGIPAWGASTAQRVLFALLVVVLVRSFDSALRGVNQIYSELPRSKERPIKGFLQVANVVAYLAGLILVVSILIDRNPVIFLSGLGALTAVLLLVFRDTLLSLVAGIQITTNDLIRVGDWIEMPQFDADGDVVDIALNSVKVQNWDLTFSVIPTHKFLEHSFRNWRGMQESGGRRIKRSFHIDQSTIRFLTEEEIDRFGEWELLGDYVAKKRAEIEAHNMLHPTGEGTGIPHARRLTNVGTFRAYVFRYLKQHPSVHQDMTILVRQLAPGPEGLPIEIYVFTSDTRWLYYEGIQADIFDHLLATVPEFGLRVFQQPSGADLRRGLGVVASDDG